MTRILKKPGLYISLFLLVACLFSFSCPSKPVKAENPVVIFPKADNTKLTGEMLGKIKTDLEAAWPAAVEKASEFLGGNSIAGSFSGLKIYILDTPTRQSYLCGEWIKPENEADFAPINFYGAQIISGQCDAEKSLTQLLIGSALYSHMKDGVWLEEPIWMGLANFGAGLFELYGTREFNISLPKYDSDAFFQDKTRMFFMRQALMGYCFDKQYGKDKTKKLITLLLERKLFSQAVQEATGDSGSKILENCDECIKSYIDAKVEKAGDYRSIFKFFYQKDFDTFLKQSEEYLKEHSDSVYLNHLHFFTAAANIRLEKYQAALNGLEGVRSGKWGPSYLAANSASSIVFSLLKIGECEKAKEKHLLFSKLYPESQYRFSQKWDTLFKEICMKEDGKEAKTSK